MYFPFASRVKTSKIQQLGYKSLYWYKTYLANSNFQRNSICFSRDEVSSGDVSMCHLPTIGRTRTSERSGHSVWTKRTSRTALNCSIYWSGRTRYANLHPIPKASGMLCNDKCTAERPTGTEFGILCWRATSENHVQFSKTRRGLGHKE